MGFVHEYIRFCPGGNIPIKGDLFFNGFAIKAIIQQAHKENSNTIH